MKPYIWLTMVLLLFGSGWALNPETGISLVKYAFDEHYENAFGKLQNYAESQRFYWFRYEAQALIDMYNATDDSRYLTRAKTIAQKAIADAIANPVEVTYRSDSIGDYPCFTHSSDSEIYHAQLTDVQGGLGLLIIAEELKEQNDAYYQTICSFVETNLVDKWVKRKRSDYATGPIYDDYLTKAWETGNNRYVIFELCFEGARDKREMLGLLCLMLKDLGYSMYPYEDYADYCFTQAFTIRADIDAADWPYNTDIHKSWGLIDQGDGTVQFYWMTQYTWDYYPIKTMTTIHSSRTAWSAVEGYQRGAIGQDVVTALVATFKHKMWRSEYIGQSYTGDPRQAVKIDPDDYYTVGPNYFFVHNQIDGTDLRVRYLNCVPQPGRYGTIAQGWHRLAEYDDEIKLLLSRAADDLVYQELVGSSVSKLSAVFAGSANVSGPMKLCALAYGAKVKKEVNPDWSLSDPVKIDNIEQLQQIQFAPDWSYILTQNIDATETNPSDADYDPNGTWADGNGFVPLGTDSDPFTGTLNGQGYTISGLYMNRPAELPVGLFRRNKGKLTNIHITDCIITGSGHVGALTGLNYTGGKISNCSSTGSIESNASRAGGLVGYNRGSNASITNCCSICEVEGNGNDNIGGLVGQNYDGAVIENCYAAGGVTSEGGSMVHKFVGYTPDDGSVQNCFYEGTGQYRGSTGKTTEQMKTLSTYTDVGWVFIGSDDDPNAVWRMCGDGIDYPDLFLRCAHQGDFECPTGVGLEDVVKLSQCWLAVTDLPAELDDDSDMRVGLSEMARLGQYWMQTGCGSCGGIDLTSDGDVKVDDLMAIINDWLEEVNPDCALCDTNGDNTVDFEDFAVMAENW